MQIKNMMWKNPVALAPMAGVTDRAFRELCVSFGAAYCVTEMISAKAIQYQDPKSAQLAVLSPKERPVAIQLFGDSPDTMAKAARQMMENEPDVIDLNMGCPAPKIALSGGGVALMRTPELCGEIVRAVCRAVTVPVTVKLRSGWSQTEINAVEVATICEEAGAAAITIHGRTREQMYRGKADREMIRAVKKAVSIPVIGNGDVLDGACAAQMLDETGCDMVMVGRAACGNPWIFAEITAFLAGKKYRPPTISERMETVRQHVAAMCAYKGERLAMQEARKHVAWYLRGLRGAAGFRKRATALSSRNDLEDLVQAILLENRAEEIDSV